MKKIILLLLVVISPMWLQGQAFQGFLTDNYSGVNSVVINPANIVDSRFRADINLIGVSAFGGNDYAGVNILDVTKSGYDFDSMANTYPTNNNNGIINIDVMGPSFMFNINSNSSIAVFTRARSFVNIHDINGEIVDDLENDDTDDFYFDGGNLKTAGNGWAELGVTYARVILNDRTKFLKGGLTVKYLQGGGSAHISGNNLTVDYDADGGGPDNGSFDTTGELTYASFDTSFDEDGYEYELPKATGVGFDLGFVYEWRTNYPDYRRTAADGSTYSLKDQNKYKLKLGLSITDIGRINYKDGTEEVYEVNNSFTEDDFDNADNLEDFLNTFYTLKSSTKGFKATLPTALHFTADWSFTRRLYVNLNTDLSLISKNKLGASRIANTVSLTPRFESKIFSFYLPMGIVQYSGFQAGAGLRFGPLYLGSGSVLSALVSDNSKAADVYAGIKIPIYQGREKDRDEDGVIDKLDACPKVPGPIENNGCPWEDTDGDGLLDNVDECPKEAGPQENKGCPWGDNDGDGVLDNVDKCPNIAGSLENDGCPYADSDGDTVFDNVDQCPDVPGPIENNGCPWKDTDGDGVADKDDNCVDVPGTVENNGCPAVTEAVLKTLSAYAKTILFHNGKSTLRPESKEVLDNIVGILNEYPNAKFNIDGHTDSSGSDALNLRLSEERASTVMNYLIENGVGASRLKATGYGESSPIDDNSTAEGRRNNRRVEVNLVK
ncbi:DUF5723 family protein [Tamlana sp. I1]|uniref:DUF5723 family protein n=1 Tax=Tamlana sp. I1 TaxID=2762061 RepID=UPI0018908F60|nr:DUF5723 family protein [Tamlana sp. I1]